MTVNLTGLAPLAPHHLDPPYQKELRCLECGCVDVAEGFAATLDGYVICPECGTELNLKTEVEVAT